MGKKKLYIPINDKYLTIDTTITRIQLIKMLSDNLIHWTECFKKCGWAENCKHANLLKHHGDDQKCCVVAKILENLISCTYGIFRKLSHHDKARYLSGITKYIELVISLKDWMGAIYDKDFVKYCGEFAPNLYGGVLRERRKMDEIAALLKNIKSFNTEIPVYLVEGPGDKALFRTFIQYSRMANFDQLKNIDVIFSKSNVRKERIDLLIKNKIRRGERTIVILDGDGSITKTRNSLMKLWEQKLIKQKDIYIFKYNIELAFPSDMLTQAMKNYIKGFNLRVKIENKQILKAIAFKGDFVTNCEKIFKISINKVEFDGLLGYLLAMVVEDKFGDVMNKTPPYDKHEIFRFLRFVVMNR